MATDWFFSAAAALAGVWLLVHLTLGGREIARPLLDADGLRAVVRETQYLCWHFTSVGIAAMASFFAAAVATGDAVWAAAGTALALGFAVVGVCLAARLSAGWRRLPQGWLFAPVAALGALGLLA